VRISGLTFAVYESESPPLENCAGKRLKSAWNYWKILLWNLREIFGKSCAKIQKIAPLHWACDRRVLEARRILKTRSVVGSSWNWVLTKCLLMLKKTTAAGLTHDTIFLPNWAKSARHRLIMRLQKKIKIAIVIDFFYLQRQQELQ